MFKLITDSTADLPAEYLEEHNVGCLPISYILDGVTYGREKQLDWKRFYACMREEGKMPTTSQINPAEAKELLEEYIQTGGAEEILYLAFSSGLSGTCGNIGMAARELMEENKELIGCRSIEVSTDVAKVSIVGAGMAHNAGVACKMFEALFSAGININMISTSEIKVSVLVDERDADRAVQAIHDRFFSEFGNA